MVEIKFTILDTLILLCSFVILKYSLEYIFNMKKVNIGLALLIIVILSLLLLRSTNADRNFSVIKEQLEVINSKLDHIEYDLHEMEEK